MLGAELEWPLYALLITAIVSIAWVVSDGLLVKFVRSPKYAWPCYVIFAIYISSGSAACMQTNPPDSITVIAIGGFLTYLANLFFYRSSVLNSLSCDQVEKVRGR